MAAGGSHHHWSIMKASLCPVCMGSGQKPDESVCHGCDGKGWVVVPELEDGVLPMPYGGPYGGGTDAEPQRYKRW